MRICLAAVVMLVALAGSARAGDYTFEIPQLVGHYLGDITAIPTFDVVVDLEMEFAQIDSASLQLIGTHMPGLVGDLNSPNTFTLPAEVIARSDRPGILSDLFIDELLPSQAGAFEFHETFRVGHFATEPPDYSPWLAGTAEFQFTVAPPPTIAIYYLIEMPSVTITSASLVIQGQPNLDAFMLSGDFDRDGTVDGQDLLTWQRNPSIGDLADWQGNYHAGALAASVAVPEPRGVLLIISSAIGIFLLRTRTNSAV